MPQERELLVFVVWLHSEVFSGPVVGVSVQHLQKVFSGLQVFVVVSVVHLSPAAGVGGLFFVLVGIDNDANKCRVCKIVYDSESSHGIGTYPTRSLCASCVCGQVFATGRSARKISQSSASESWLFEVCKVPTNKVVQQHNRAPLPQFPWVLLLSWRFKFT